MNLTRSNCSPYTFCTINKVPIHACIDTGSSKTIISVKLFQQLKGPFAVSNALKMKLAHASDMMAREIGPVSIEFMNGAKKISHMIYVANIQDDMLLGYDALKKMKAMVDTEKEELTFKDTQLASKLFKAQDLQLRTKEETQVQRVVLKNAITIPAKSEAVVRVQCPPCGSEFAYFEPEELESCVASRTLCRGDAWPIINMVNTSEMRKRFTFPLVKI